MKIQLLIITAILGMLWVFPVVAGHNLREIERYCEVEWDGEEGELDCRSTVKDRRSIERKCSAEWDGYEGVLDCRGSHYRNIERKCVADRDGEIDC